MNHVKLRSSFYPALVVIAISILFIILSLGIICGGVDSEKEQGDLDPENSIILTQEELATSTLTADSATGIVTTEEGQIVSNAMVDKEGRVYFDTGNADEEDGGDGGENDDIPDVDIPDGYITPDGHVEVLVNLEVDPEDYRVFHSSLGAIGMMLDDWNMVTYENELINRDDLLQIISRGDLISRDGIFNRETGDPLINRSDFFEREGAISRDDIIYQYAEVIQEHLSAFTLAEPQEGELSISFTLTDANASKMMKMRQRDEEDQGTDSIYKYLIMEIGITCLNREGFFEHIDFHPCTKVDRDQYTCRVPLVIRDIRDLVCSMGIFGTVKDDVPWVLEDVTGNKYLDGQIAFQSGNENSSIYRIDLNRPRLGVSRREGLTYIIKDDPSLGRFNSIERDRIYDRDGNLIIDLFGNYPRVDRLKELLNE